MNVQNISKILKVMETEAKKRNAPVFKVESVRATPFRSLVFVMLSARTKDATTLNAVEKLFKIATMPEKISEIKISKLEQILYGVGFYRVKAKYLKKMCKMLVSEFHGKVPDNIDDMLKLPGIGRKSANIVLARHFGKHVIGVDTHVHRISNRLGLVKTKKPLETEKTLMKKIPKRHLRLLNRTFVAYGQTICQPVSPSCSICKLNNICPRIDVKTSR